MEKNKEDNKKKYDPILGFGYTLNEFLDHLSLLSWVEYIAHKCDVGREVKNFDERDWIELPSGRKIIITVKIEDYKEEDNDPEGTLS